MNLKSEVMKSFFVLTLCTIGGALLAASGLSIGWMIGSLMVSVALIYIQPAALKLSKSSMDIWLRAGQLLLGIELGLQLNPSVFNVLKENILTIIIVLVLSMIYSIGSGILLYKICKLDMLTSFYSSAPGGLSAMPGMAKEAGANMGIVAILQTSRILLVVLLVPFFILGTSHTVIGPDTENITNTGISSSFNGWGLLWTTFLTFTAWGGFHFGKRVNLPAPWLVGSMFTVAFFHAFGSVIAGTEIIAWWPDSIMILSQIMIGASVGSMIHKGMFKGIRKIMFVFIFSTVGFILTMMACALIISKISGISFITTALALAPGGVAEMTATSVALQADPMFVVAVQILRVVMVYTLLPPLFNLVNDRALKREEQSRMTYK